MPTAAVIAVVGVALAAWAAVADRGAGMTWAATALDCAVGLAFVTAGATSGLRPLRMVGVASVGYAWLLASTVQAASTLHRGLLVVALLVWAAPGLVTRWRRTVLYAVALAAAVGAGGQLGAAALLVAAAVVAALPSEGRRSQAWPASASVAVVGLVLAGAWVWSRTDPQRFHPDAAVTAYELALVGAAATVVVVRRRLRSSRERALQMALATVGDGGMAGFVELLRRAVGDPTLDVVEAGGAAALMSGTQPGAGALTVVTDDGTPLCVVVHHSPAMSDPVTAARVAAATRLAVEHVRLTDELSRQLVEVEASRARLLTATDLERASAAAELHDRVDPLLERARAGIESGLQRTADDSGSGEPARAAARELSTTAAELDGLVAGVAPFPLGGGRLVEALNALSARSPLPVDVRSEGDPRSGAEEEAALYFACSEALANAFKHSRATRVSVTLHAEGDAVRLAVSDDGMGGADPAGAGLTALADRLAARGGELHVSSDRSRGTVVTATVPARAVTGSWSTGGARTGGSVPGPEAG